MMISNLSETQHLPLDSLVIIPSLVRRLAPALTLRFHALPLAEGNGCITLEEQASLLNGDQLVRGPHRRSKQTVENLAMVQTPATIHPSIKD
jgi:hypothetical protein